MEFKKLLLSLLGLPATATDEEIIARCKVAKEAETGRQEDLSKIAKLAGLDKVETADEIVAALSAKDFCFWRNRWTRAVDVIAG